MIANLAWRNLWRQKTRTLLSIGSIAFTAALLVFVLSFQLGVYAQMKATVLKLFDGYAQLQAHGYSNDPDLKKTIEHPLSLVTEARNIDGVSALAPRINTFAILANGERSYGAAVIGVDPTSEPVVSTLPATVREGRYLVATDSDTAVIGDILARNLRLTVGQKVTLLGATWDGSVAADVLRVIGIFHSGLPEIDRQMLEMPLSRAQATFGLGDRANTVAVVGPTLSDVNGALPALKQVADRHRADLADWSALEPSLSDSITLKYMTSAALYATLVIITVFIILNTLLMSVLERTREFGMLMALGMRPTVIGRMVWLELISLALIGNAIGLLIGGAVSLYFMRHGIGLPGLGKVLAQFGLPDRLYPALDIVSASIGPGAIMIGVCLAGLVPYLHVQRLEAASAMRAT